MSGSYTCLGVSGLRVALDLPYLLAIILSVVFAGMPVIGTGLGIWGAYKGWGWSLQAACSLFLVPFAIPIIAILTDKVYDLIERGRTS